MVWSRPEIEKRIATLMSESKSNSAANAWSRFLLPDIRRRLSLDAVDILFARSNPLNADDEWPGNVDPRCMCIGRLSIGGCHDVEPTTLEVLSANAKMVLRNEFGL